jgi:hypothetical protein
MAEVGSKTTANVYANKKGVERVQVMFDASKLGKDASLSESLLHEVRTAIKTAKGRKEA